MITATYQLFITLGILTASAINCGTRHISGSASWRVPMGIGMLWSLILGIGIQFLDESPTWDVRQDRVDSAQVTLAKLYKTQPRREDEMRQLLAASNADRAAGKGSFKGVFTEQTILYRFVVGVGLMMLQQLSGINYFFYFGTELFKNLGVGDGYITAIILGAVNFLATLVGIWVSNRFKHRLVLTLGSFWIGTCLLVSH